MVSDIKLWLEDLDLVKYVDVFIENEIGLRDLSHITDDDLRELGLPLGPRKRIMGAINALTDVATPTLKEAVATGDATASRAERRQLTVMFCDLVGSTALSQQLDPEDLHEVIRVYQNTVAGEIARYEGHVAKFMGDGVIAYYGYPHAHEDDAERAIRSALSIVQAIPKLQLGDTRPLQVRIGIATGQVVVGDIIGEGAAQEEAVVGDTPNLAARLQELAAPNSIVASAATRDLTGNVFDFADLGRRSLKGMTEPTQVWRVDRERMLESRFEGRTARLTAFVGREHEVGLLLERWQRAKDGETLCRKTTIPRVR